VIRVPAIVLWAIAFAYVESAVVEYLRSIYYPLERGGFQFPVLSLEQLESMGPEHIRRLIIELGREISTLVMLVTISVSAAGNRREAWAYFLIAFGTWDIFYYLWLKLFLGWPRGIMTWDLLFLVPVPWVAPVLAPILISMIMIAAGLVVLAFEWVGRPLHMSWSAWALIVLGGLVVIVSFCLDFRAIMAGGHPSPFNWPLFGAGLATALIPFLWSVLRQMRAVS
jgi:hypothetical protein